MKIEITINEALQFVEAIDGHLAVGVDHYETEFLKSSNSKQTRGASNLIMKIIREQIASKTFIVEFSKENRKFLSELIKEHARWMKEYQEGGDTKKCIKISRVLAKKIKNAEAKNGS